MNEETKFQNAQMGNNPELLSPYWTPKPEFPEDQLVERSFDLYRLWQISQVRESALPQFDGMGYSRYNETNEMADMSFLAPKKNKGDSRITTGITHEKDSSLVGFFLNMSFEGTVRVFHNDKEELEIGTALTKLVRKSREEEFYDDKRPMFYQNFVVQGTSFAHEEYYEAWVPDKSLITDDIDPTALDQVKWIDKGLKKEAYGCVSNLIDGKKVFLENIRERDIQKQPGVYTVEYVPRELMKGIWGKTANWKYVPYMINPSATSIGTLSQASIYSDWVYGEIDFNKCEVIKVYRPFEQRYQIYINGIPMLKPKFPLKAISPSGLIPIAKGDLDIMNLFAYSKSQPAKTKIDQAIFDEILQNMLIKSRQSAFVPRVNNTDKILTPDMFLGGKMISNINNQDVNPLIDNPGITPADFSFYQLLKTQIGEKTLTAAFEGSQDPNTGSVSLEQYMDMQKRNMLKLAKELDGAINWEKQMLRLRVMNLLVHPTDKDDDDEYKNITTMGNLSNGTNGINIMKFQSPIQKTSEDVFNEQNQYSEQNGQDAEISYLDPKMMKEMLDDDSYYFCYEIIPVEKNNDKVTQMMFVSMVEQAANLFGPESLQVDSLKKQYAQVMGRSYDDLFISAQDLQAKQQQAAIAAQTESASANGKEKGTAIISSIQPNNNPAPIINSINK